MEVIIFDEFELSTGSARQSTPLDQEIERTVFVNVDPDGRFRILDTVECFRSIPIYSAKSAPACFGFCLRAYRSTANDGLKKSNRPLMPRRRRGRYD